MSQEMNDRGRTPPQTEHNLASDNDPRTRTRDTPRSRSPSRLDRFRYNPDRCRATPRDPDATDPDPVPSKRRTPPNADLVGPTATKLSRRGNRRVYVAQPIVMRFGEVDEDGNPVEPPPLDRHRSTQVRSPLRPVSPAKRGTPRTSQHDPPCSSLHSVKRATSPTCPYAGDTASKANHDDLGVTHSDSAPSSSQSYVLPAQIARQISLTHEAESAICSPAGSGRTGSTDDAQIPLDGTAHDYDRSAERPAPSPTLPAPFRCPPEFLSSTTQRSEEKSFHPTPIVESLDNAHGSARRDPIAPPTDTSSSSYCLGPPPGSFAARELLRPPPPPATERSKSTPTHRLVALTIGGVTSLVQSLVETALASSEPLSRFGLAAVPNPNPNPRSHSDDDGNPNDDEGEFGRGEVGFLRREVNRLANQVVDKERTILQLSDRLAAEAVQVARSRDELEALEAVVREVEIERDRERERVGWMKEAKKGLVREMRELEQRCEGLEREKQRLEDARVERGHGEE